MNQQDRQGSKPLFMKYVWWLCLSLLATRAVFAGGSEVVVIYNTRVPASKTVADHYAAVRQVPTNQIFGFALTTNEVITRADFTDFLQNPLLEKLERTGLWKFGAAEVPAAGAIPAHTEERVTQTKIRYAVLCYGVPLKIASDPALKETPAALHMSGEFRRDEAAVDSELVWLPLIHMNVPLLGPVPNRLYACTNRPMFTPLNGLLLVSRLDGPTPEIASGLVDKAVAAETSGLWGRAYFDLRGLSPSNSLYQGDIWLHAGSEICRQLGFDVDVDTNADTFPESYPLSQVAVYAGWYDADVSGPFRRPEVEFMPGAFAYHLHSYSAETLRSPTSRWCGPLLAGGATCTMGCVYEPYLQFTPNIAVFLECLGNGYTFGEAAWAAQLAISWQTTVIGDPLYQPFGKSLIERHSELAQSHSPLIEWSFERMINSDLARGARPAIWEDFLKKLPATDQSAVLTEKLAEIEDAMGQPDPAIAAWQNALKLNPSHQQRIRIRRVLEEKLVARGRKAEAIENDQKLLTEAPDYPAKSHIEDELKALEAAETKK